MARTANIPATPVSTAEVMWPNEKTVTAQNELADLQTNQDEAARALAVQIGYEGSLTVGALEDEIRFYQRRTVEAILETGKRLLLLKEMVPHGQFEARAELLGFTSRTARRFMQAAFKTAKSDILSVLSKQAKNGLAFLELVTHDDDELQELGGMDDVDRMSASQLRAKFRDLQAEKEAIEKVSARKSEQIDKLQLVHVLPPQELMHEVKKKALAVSHDALGALRGGVRQALTAINDAPDEPNKAVFMASMLGELQAELNAIRTEFNLPDVSTAADQALAADVAAWAN
jgi:hypothetical protein